MAGYPTKRRANKPKENTLYDDSKTLADMMWEDAVRLAEALAPEVPTDAEELDEFSQFNILMMAAAEFSPGYWDDPDALEDLFRLKKQFMNVEDVELRELAKVAKVQRKGIPDPMMTPQHPDWEKVVRG